MKIPDHELKKVPISIDDADELILENLLFNLSKLIQYFLEGDPGKASRKAAYSIYWAAEIIKEKSDEKD